MATRRRQPAVAALVDEIFDQDDDFDVSVYDLSSSPRHTQHGRPHPADLSGTAGPHRRRHAFLCRVPVQAAGFLGRDPAAFRGRAEDIPAEAPGPGPQGTNLVPYRSGPGLPGDRRPARPRRAGVGLPGRAEVAGTADRRRAAALPHAQQAERSGGPGEVALRPRAATGNRAKSSGCARWPRGSSRTPARWRPWAPILATPWTGPAAIAPGAAGAASRPSCPPRPKPKIDPALWSQANSRRDQHGGNSAIPVRSPDSSAA